ncbi:MAG: sensory histidine kinase AtoS [Methanobacterium sp. PtaB.Bin024]|nr:MAG: sensory histidine kinase AtoS [Methanobacterium sp. PtaB.Bin024]
MKGSNQEDLSNKLDALEKRIHELERQLADKEFQLEKSKLMMQLLDSATDSVFLHDFDGNFVYVNEAAYKTRGYTKKELLGMNLHDLDVPNYEKLIKPRIKDLMEKGEFTFETAHFRKDGSQLPVEVHSKIIRYKDKPLVLSYVRDITERKHIENALISAQEQYNALFDDIGVGVSFISPKMEILDLNDQMKEWFPHIDVSKKPICYKAFNDPPKEDRCTYCPTYKTLEDGEVHESVTDTPVGGEIINYRIVSSPIKDEEGNVVAAIEMVEDITARKRAEEGLKRAYATFNSIFEGPENIIAFSLDCNYQYIFFNEAHKQTMKNIWGVGIEIGKNMLDYISYPEDREKAKINFDRALSGENFIELEDYGEENFSRRYWENIYNPIQSGKDVIGLTVFCIDITEREKANEKLRQSEEKFRAVTESAIDVIITADSKGIITFFNHSLLELFGYTASELYGKPVSIIVPQKHKNGHLKGMELFESGERQKTGKTTVVTGLKKDGTEFPCEMSLSSWKLGEDTYFTSIIRDLTERKKAEEALKKSEEKYRNIFENVQDVFFQTDIKGKIIEVSPSVEKQFGIKPTKLIGNPVSLLYANHEDRKKLLKVLREKREVSDYEIALRDSENRLVYFSANVHFIYDSKNQPIGIEGALRDITDRKKAEEALKLSQIHLENAMDLAHLVNWEFDMDDMVFRFNDRFYSMYGTTADQEGGYLMSVEDYVKNFVHPEDVPAIAKGFRQTEKTGQPGFPEEMEHRIVRRDGETLYISVHIHFICDDEGKLIGSYGSNQDITDRKIAEEKLKESLEEKEMLVKEIHHRVKNNLMVISSLLNLQSQYIKDKEAFDIFKESQNRARSMALIHERLYRSTDLKKIDFGDYIHTLATDLFHTYVTDPSRVKLNMDVENVMVDINTTVPLGLIVNELVTNSMKYAFPEGETGEIDIEFNKKEDLFTLIVRDTGVGFPEGLNFRNTSSLGLQLVNNLVSQIDGEITLDRSRGTEFKITFKEVEYKKRT